MKRFIKTTSAAALLTLSIAVPSAQAMQDQLNALTGAIYNSLSDMQMELAGINDLTLSEIHVIGTIMHSGDSEGEKKAQINTILRNANDR